MKIFADRYDPKNVPGIFSELIKMELRNHEKYEVSSLLDIFFKQLSPPACKKRTHWPAMLAANKDYFDTGVDDEIKAFSCSHAAYFAWKLKKYDEALQWLDRSKEVNSRISFPLGDYLYSKSHMLQLEVHRFEVLYEMGDEIEAQQVLLEALRGIDDVLFEISDVGSIYFSMIDSLGLIAIGHFFAKYSNYPSILSSLNLSSRSVTSFFTKHICNLDTLDASSKFRVTKGDDFDIVGQYYGISIFETSMASTHS